MSTTGLDVDLDRGIELVELVVVLVVGLRWFTSEVVHVFLLLWFVFAPVVHVIVNVFLVLVGVEPVAAAPLAMILLGAVCCLHPDRDLAKTS